VRTRKGVPLEQALARRRLYALAGLAASGLVALAIVLVLLTRTGGGGRADDTGVATALAAAGCTYSTFPDQGRNHVDSLDAKVDYNSLPPTSGPHYFRPAPWNPYDGPLPQVQLVHNLEHGGIVVQYGSKVPATTVDELTSFDQQDPNGIVLAPLPRLKGKIALTAWTHLAECSRFNEKAFTTFRDAFRAKGPEPFPLSALKPGT